MFASPNGLPMRHSIWYRRTFKPAVRRALPPEKQGLRFHDLRHTAASLMIAAGAHPKAISERLGHADIRITMNRYGHMLPSVDAGANGRPRRRPRRLPHPHKQRRGPSFREPVGSFQEHDYGLAPLRVRGLERVQLHADLTILARLSQALNWARAVPLAA